MILIKIFVLVIGFAALIKGADIFVDGSSALARRLKVPETIIGLTIVALGTSAPELAVSTSAALKGANEIAISNVIGSNLFNLLGVLGACSLLQRLPVDRDLIRRDFPLSIAITALLIVMVGKPEVNLMGNYNINIGSISHASGRMLLIGFVSYIFALIFQAQRVTYPEIYEEKILPMPKCIIMIVIGVALIIAGGQFVVNSARDIASVMGMGETLIGLTIVAIGTSLPELVTSLVASKKGQAGLAVGNVVGSNLLNILLIIGVSATIHPIAVNMASFLDLCVLLAVSTITYAFAISARSICRIEGIFMLMLYVADVIWACIR